MVETSIIIRCRNEEKYIGIVLENLFNQTYEDFEIIVIDSGSTDKTLEIIKKFPVKLLEIPYKDFSYPYALNYGIGQSKALKYIVILSAHSIPVSKTWLEDGLKNFYKYHNIMGVYGPLRALPDSTIWDKVYFNFGWWIRKILLINRSKEFLIEKSFIGVMGFTNAIISKNLWEKRKFNENYGAGGEDGEWANYWFKKGYKAVKDEKFTVFHSHNLNLCGWRKQINHWQSLAQPKPFHPEDFSFRKSRIFKR